MQFTFVGICFILLRCVSFVAPAENPTLGTTAPVPPQTVRVPAPPTIPAVPVFADELAGRRLMFTLRDRLRTAPAVAYTARLVRAQADTVGASVRASFAGTEQVKAQPVRRQLFVVTENVTDSARLRRISRVISDGQSITATLYESHPANRNTADIRTVSRLSLDEGTPIAQATLAVGGAPMAAQTQLLLGLQNVGRSTLFWRDPQASKSGSDVVLAIDGERRGNVVRRFTFAPNASLTQYEEWGTGGRGTAYRRDDYTNERVSASRFAPATWAQTVPANYGEKPVERVPETVAIPSEADPRALAVLTRWRNVQERFLSYRADVVQTTQATPRSQASRPLPPERANAQAAFTVETRRGGKARVFGGWTQGGDKRRAPQSILYVSDGTRLRVVNRDTGETGTQTLNTPDQLWARLFRMGLGNSWQAWEWIFESTPVASNFDRLVYEGKGDEEGEPVEIIRLENTTMGNRRRGTTVENETVLRVFLAANGLPVRIDTQNSSENVSGLTFDRDQPPIFRTTTRYRNVRVDREPSSGAFDIPK